MPERPHSRRATRAARETAARRRRWLALGAAALLTVAAAVIIVAATSEEAPLEAGSPEELAHGQEVFQQNCATCHGDELQGTFVGPPFLDEIYAPEHHPDDAFRNAVANGVQPHHWDFAAMPPVPGLSDQDVDAVIAYVRSQQEAAGIGPSDGVG